MSGWSDSAEGVPSEYLEGLRRAGLFPAVIGPPARRSGPEEVAEILAPWAGLVLCGGADVDPSAYGEETDPSVYGVDDVRDDFEILAVRAALGARTPILAVCRGIQILNVALGGTLVQHLPDVEGTAAHGVPIGDGIPVTHDVRIAAGSRLSTLLGGVTRLGSCVSIHHQAVGRVADGLVVTGRSPDGVIEAIEPAGAAGWCVAVQWHPERAAARDRAQQAIFDGFAAAVSNGPFPAPPDDGPG